MAHKKFKRFWLCYGVLSGFGLGFSVNQHWFTLDLGFFYISVEF